MKVNLAVLAKGARRLLKKITHVRATRREHKNIKVAHESCKKSTDTCKICFAETYVGQMFLIPSCLHSYCLACMSEHVEYKLLDGVLPTCPHENCKTELQPDSCKEFLSPNLVNIMSQRLKEAYIPAQDRIYCPNPRCSALFSRTELRGSKKNSTRARKCPSCSGIFCIKCEVPWHDNMTCIEYKTQNPCTSREERELRLLAIQERWRQCPRCRDMVSLASGCYHIYCRCGRQFCYKCGAKWGQRRQTCRCPIWDERNIIYTGQNVGQVDHQQKSHPMGSNIRTLLANGLHRLLRILTRVCAPRKERKYAKLARNTDKKKITKTCEICSEDIHVDQMIQILGCLHSYCSSCMSRHVQYKLLQGVLPNCPHENCKSMLKLDTCKKFLAPKLISMMSQRFKEAFIPAKDKIYCPNPRCSVLLSKEELQGYEGSSRGATKCPNCSAIFCIKCKVPWHDDMTCQAYKRKNHHASIEERELHSLAARERWRQCPDCGHMVSLVRGCAHIYCRCGNPFCYKCGANWASCRCPI